MAKASTSALMARLAAVRELAKKQDTEVSDTRPANLSLFLALYNKASHECYIDYMAGAKALMQWLSPTGCALPHRYSRTELVEAAPKIKLLVNFEVTMLAHIVGNLDAVPYERRVAVAKAYSYAIVLELIKGAGYDLEDKRTTS